MDAAYKARIAASKARLDAELLSDARRFGHHGVAAFIKIARERLHVAITEDYARDLIQRASR